MNAKRVKYPQIPHLPWSPGRSEDDIALDSIEHLEGLEDVVVTEKSDGENTTLYHDYLHVRSLDSKSHPSRIHPPCPPQGGIGSSDFTRSPGMTFPKISGFATKSMNSS
jgi:hypothetical protein